MNPIPYSLNQALAYLLIDSAASQYDSTTRTNISSNITHDEIIDAIEFLKTHGNLITLKQAIFNHITMFCKDYSATTTFNNYNPEYFI